MPHRLFRHLMLAHAVIASLVAIFVTGGKTDADKDGYASLPEGPGLGVEIDEKKVLELHAKMPKTGAWPNPRHERDGGVADY